MAYVATFQGRAAKSHVETVKQSLQTLARESVAQAGTHRYEFYQSAAEPEVFLLFAIWETEADWQAHVTSDTHNRHVNSLPVDAWAEKPTRIVWQALTD